MNFLKKYFLNGRFRPAPFNLVWDGLLLWFIVFPLLTFEDQASNYGFGTSAIMISLFTLWFVWRRTWLQRALQAYFQAQQLAEMEQRQKHVEHQQKKGLEAHVRVPQTTENNEEDTVETEEELADSLSSFYTVYTIALPLSVKWDVSQAIAFLRSLLSQVVGVQLAVVAQPQRVYWEVTCFNQDEEREALSQQELEEIVRAHYPGAQVKAVKRSFAQLLHRRYLIFEAQYHNYFDRGPSAQSIRGHDPLAAIVRVCSQLQAGEQLRYVVSVIGTTYPTEKQLQEALFVSAREVYRPQFSRISTSGSDAFLSSVAGNLIGWVNQEVQLRGTKLLRFSEAQTQEYLKKLSQPLVYSFVSVEMDTPTPKRLSLLETLVGTVEQITAGAEIRLIGAEGASSAYRSPLLKVTDEIDALAKSPLDYVMRLAPRKPGQVDGRDPYLLALTFDELAALWHLPSQLLAELSEWIEQPSLVPPELLDPDPQQAVMVGTADGQNVGIQRRDLNLHAFVAGMQGQGKSTLLLNIAQQLIQSGQGVAVLDPHRNLINSILASAIDDQALTRTVLLEAEDSLYPLPLNPMRATPGMSKEALFSSLMWVIKAIYAKSWSEGQMERLFRNILQIVLTDPEATPLDIQKLLEDANYRRRAIAATRKAQGRLSHALEDFWQRFEEDPISVQRDRTSPVLNRLGVFLDGQMELMMAHPFGLDFRTIIGQKKVLLFDLAGGSMMSEADNLGSIFFAMLFFHSFALGEIKAGEPPRYYLLIDETHRFVKAPIQQMFSEARKYGLSLIMADQWLGQLEEETRQGIINNKGTTISFRVAPDQARETAKLLEPHVSAERLVKQGQGEAAVATIYHGRTLPAFTLKTLPPPLSRLSVKTQREQAKAQLPSILFSPNPSLTPKRMTVAEVDDWLRQRYNSGIFARDLRAEAVYEDSVPVPPSSPPPPTSPTSKMGEEDYTDSEAI